MINIFGWLRPVGKFLKKAFGFIDKYVTDEAIELAVSWVKVAKTTLTDNESRRALVMKVLMTRLGLSENVARLIVEIAVGIVKQEDSTEDLTVDKTP